MNKKKINLDEYIGKLFPDVVCEIAITLGLPVDEEVGTVVIDMMTNGYYPCIKCFKVLPLDEYPIKDICRANKDSGICNNCS